MATSISQSSANRVEERPYGVRRLDAVLVRLSSGLTSNIALRPTAQSRVVTASPELRVENGVEPPYSIVAPGVASLLLSLTVGNYG